MAAEPQAISFIVDLPELITAIAAIAAIAASSYFQNKTLKESRTTHAENAKQHKETVLASIVAGHRQNWIDNVREDISHYIPLTYEISNAYKDAMKNNTPWPGEHYELLLKEDTLRNRILLRLNPDISLHHELAALLDELRDSNHKTAWTDRRNRLQDCTRKVLRKEWEHLKRGDLSGDTA